MGGLHFNSLQDDLVTLDESCWPLTGATPQDLTTRHALVARGARPRRVDRVDCELGTVTDRPRAERLERSVQEVDLDTRELSNLHVKLVHPHAAVCFGFSLHAID